MAMVIPVLLVLATVNLTSACEVSDTQEESSNQADGRRALQDQCGYGKAAPSGAPRPRSPGPPACPAHGVIRVETSECL